MKLADFAEFVDKNSSQEIKIEWQPRAETPQETAYYSEADETFFIFIKVVSKKTIKVFQYHL